jgi:hypothetical protein
MDGHSGFRYLRSLIAAGHGCHCAIAEELHIPRYPESTDRQMPRSPFNPFLSSISESSYSSQIHQFKNHTGPLHAPPQTSFPLLRCLQQTSFSFPTFPPFPSSKHVPALAYTKRLWLSKHPVKKISSDFGTRQAFRLVTKPAAGADRSAL